MCARITPQANEPTPRQLAAMMPVKLWALGIRALTFDCYGTLIDWETGIVDALRPLFGRAGGRLDRGALIAAYSRHERAAESGAYMPYREVLARVEAALAHEFGLGGARDTDDPILSTSLADWPVFDETPAALKTLGKRFRLGVLSNIDDDLFGITAPKLGERLDLLVTAQQVKSYKPGRAHFEEALRRLQLTPDRVLHVAESRYHDIEPAGELGFRTCWVNRHAQAGDDNSSSASGPMVSGRAPDLTVTSLAELVRVLDC